eukprot:c11575_g1_i1.p1 GENE.c11575_g1_i1~~c11575_g1_i1.p1  ORF type:complete len:1016 (+),score=110.72 c11575_g1_i1:181-3228(+)
MFGTLSDHKELSAREKRKLEQQIALIKKQESKHARTSNRQTATRHNISPKKPSKKQPDSPNSSSPEDGSPDRFGANDIDNKPREFKKRQNEPFHDSPTKFAKTTELPIQNGGAEGEDQDHPPVKRRSAVSAHELASLVTPDIQKSITISIESSVLVGDGISPSTRQSRQARQVSPRASEFVGSPPSEPRGLTTKNSQDSQDPILQPARPRTATPPRSTDDTDDQESQTPHSGTRPKRPRNRRKVGMTSAERAAVCAAEIAAAVQATLVQQDKGRFFPPSVDVVEFRHSGSSQPPLVEPVPMSLLSNNLSPVTLMSITPTFPQSQPLNNPGSTSTPSSTTPAQPAAGGAIPKHKGLFGKKAWLSNFVKPSDETLQPTESRQVPATSSQVCTQPVMVKQEPVPSAQTTTSPPSSVVPVATEGSASASGNILPEQISVVKSERDPRFSRNLIGTPSASSTTGQILSPIQLPSTPNSISSLTLPPSHLSVAVSTFLPASLISAAATSPSIISGSVPMMLITNPNTDSQPYQADPLLSGPPITSESKQLPAFELSNSTDLVGPGLTTLQECLYGNGVTGQFSVQDSLCAGQLSESNASKIPDEVLARVLNSTLKARTCLHSVLLLGKVPQDQSPVSLGASSRSQFPEGSTRSRTLWTDSEFSEFDMDVDEMASNLSCSTSHEQDDRGALSSDRFAVPLRAKTSSPSTSPQDIDYHAQSLSNSLSPMSSSHASSSPVSSPAHLHSYPNVKSFSKRERRSRFEDSSQTETKRLRSDDSLPHQPSSHPRSYRPLTPPQAASAHSSQPQSQALSQSQMDCSLSHTATQSFKNHRSSNGDSDPNLSHTPTLKHTSTENGPTRTLNYPSISPTSTFSGPCEIVKQIPSSAGIWVKKVKPMPGLVAASPPPRLTPPIDTKTPNCHPLTSQFTLEPHAFPNHSNNPQGASSSQPQATVVSDSPTIQTNVASERKELNSDLSPGTKPKSNHNSNHPSPVPQQHNQYPHFSSCSYVRSPDSAHVKPNHHY